jgi:hypothetical protein
MIMALIRPEYVFWSRQYGLDAASSVVTGRSRKGADFVGIIVA